MAPDAGAHAAGVNPASPHPTDTPTVLPEVYLESYFKLLSTVTGGTVRMNENTDVGSVPSEKTPTGTKPHNWTLLEEHSSAT